MKILFRKTLELFGWKLIGEFPNVDKSVVIMAPHTSNWDFIIGRFYLSAIGISNNTLMKKEMFVFPLNYALKALGAIPVDRQNKNISIVSQTVSMYKKREKLNLFIAPEGTRKKTTKWKKGFYYIAQGAGVPIVLSFIDYKKKEIGIKGIVKNSDNFDKTMEEISEYYRDVNAKFPEKFSLDQKYN